MSVKFKFLFACPTAVRPLDIPSPILCFSLPWRLCGKDDPGLTSRKASSSPVSEKRILARKWIEELTPTAGVRGISLVIIYSR